ncbi:MAG: chemotaxis protein CheW [Deltaproteobacteria bacterium]|nr:chemotaxis protein CheW [Deltaproteobacteria bacterium]
MTARSGERQDRVASLRRDFDESFARPGSTGEAPRERFLTLCVADVAYAVRLEQVAALHADRRVVPLPSGTPALLGVAGFRGSVVPVYRLDLLLGLAESAPARWLILSPGPDPVALAFHRYEGPREVAPAELHPALPEAWSSAGLVTHTLSLSGELRSVLSVPALVELIRRRIAAPLHRKEP